MYLCVHGGKAWEAAEGFAPEWEAAGERTAVFDIGPLGRLYRKPEGLAEAVREAAGEEAAVAVAPDVDTAVILARNRRGVTVARRGAEALAELPVEALAEYGGEGWEEYYEVLEMWGIRTLGELARLPEAGIAARFGETGARLQRLAGGRERRPVRVERAEGAYEGRVELDEGVSEREPLLFAVGRILSEQCGRLAAEGRAAHAVRLRLEMESGGVYEKELKLPAPVGESLPLLKLLRLELEARGPEGAVVAVGVGLEAAGPRRVQEGLFAPPVPEPMKMELTLERIRGWVGEENVGVPELKDTHGPEPFALRSGKRPEAGKGDGKGWRAKPAFRYFRPPLKARVARRGRAIARVEAGRVAGAVVKSAGPWRSSGGWWTEGEWDRQEWDVKLEGGVLCRVYQERGGEWFVEGVYD